MNIKSLLELYRLKGLKSPTFEQKKELKYLERLKSELVISNF